MSMNHDVNIVMKKTLQKMFDFLLKKKKYNDFSSVDVTYAFTSRFKTAMCQSVVGVKIKTKVKGPSFTELLSELKKDIKKITDEHFGHTVCVLDVIIED